MKRDVCTLCLENCFWIGCPQCVIIHSCFRGSWENAYFCTSLFGRRRCRQCLPVNRNYPPYARQLNVLEKYRRKFNGRERRSQCCGSSVREKIGPWSAQPQSSWRLHGYGNSTSADRRRWLPRCSMPATSRDQQHVEIYLNSVHVSAAARAKPAFGLWALMLP